MILRTVKDSNEIASSLELVKAEPESECDCTLPEKGLHRIFFRHLEMKHTKEASCDCSDGLKIKTDCIRNLMSQSVFAANGKSSNSYHLCKAGLNLKQSFQEHIQARHSDEVKLFNEIGISMTFCLCPEGIVIQSTIIDHLMKRYQLDTLIIKPEQIIKPKHEQGHWDDDTSTSSFEVSSAESPLQESHIKPAIKSFVCESCSFSSPDRNLLKLHWKSEHDPSNEFVCTRKYCRSQFKSKAELDLHGRVHERSSALTKSCLCHVCSKIFDTSTQLKAHLKTHQEKCFSCDMCSSKFKTRQEVKVHILRHKGLWQYSKVQRLYPSKTRVKKERTEKIPDEQKPYKCRYDACLRRFKLQSQLNDHINVHLGVKPYKCEFCQESFRAKNGLTTHRKIHTDPFKNWCELCQRRFSTKIALQDHNESLHSSAFPYACTYCEQAFRLKKQLLAHIESHERITCEICSKSVLIQKYEKHKFKYHPTSSCEKPFACDQPGCSASFLYSAHLNDHKNVHLNLRPHICSVCNEGFNYRSAMLRHRKIHDEPDKYRCTICEKSYASAYSLSLHDRLHTNDQSQRPFACAKCGMTFKFKDHVQKHYRKMHQKAGRVSCEICSKMFFSNYHLIRHKATVHVEANDRDKSLDKSALT